MIEESQYRLPNHEQPKHEPTDEELRQAAETLKFLDSLPWQPFDVEW